MNYKGIHESNSYEETIKFVKHQQLDYAINNYKLINHIISY